MAHEEAERVVEAAGEQEKLVYSTIEKTSIEETRRRCDWNRKTLAAATVGLAVCVLGAKQNWGRYDFTPLPGIEAKAEEVAAEGS